MIFLVYFFSNEPMNLWNICAITVVVVFSGLYIFRTRTKYYIVDESGIFDVQSNKLIAANTITRIKMNDEQLAVDTTKYKNDLTLSVTNLKKPTWQELLTELSKLNTNVG